MADGAVHFLVRQRLAGDAAVQFTERNHRPRQRDGSNQDAEIRLDVMYRFFSAGERPRVAQKIRIADEHGGETDKAVQDCDQLGHLRHLHASRQHEADAGAQRKTGCKQLVVLGNDTKNRRDERDRHSRYAIDISAPRSFGAAQAAERENEQNRRRDV